MKATGSVAEENAKTMRNRMNVYTSQYRSGKMKLPSVKGTRKTTDTSAPAASLPRTPPASPTALRVKEEQMGRTRDSSPMSFVSEPLLE